jgi:hypothetical protein
VVDALIRGDAAPAGEVELTGECCEEGTRVVCLAAGAGRIERQGEPGDVRVRAGTSVPSGPYDDLLASIDRDGARTAHASGPEEIRLGVRVRDEPSRARAGAYRIALRPASSDPREGIDSSGFQRIVP